MTKLFISHSHRDHEIARSLVDIIESFFSVPNESILCSSVPGYELDLGSLTSDELRTKLSIAELVIALLSPNSLMSNWVLFELGAAWGIGKSVVPLLVGDLDLSEKDLPAALKQNLAGRVSSRNDLLKLIDKIEKSLDWNVRNQRLGIANIDSLIEKTKHISFPFIPNDILEELGRSYKDKIDNLSEKQEKILRFVQSKNYLVNQNEIRKHDSEFRNMGNAELYYRLDRLRILGFVEKQQTGGSSDRPEYSYRIIKRYLDYINSSTV